MTDQETEELEKREEREEEFGEILTFTASGFGAGLVLGALLDYLGFEKSAVGQWVVRTVTGEGESIFEGIYALRRRIAGKMGSMAGLRVVDHPSQSFGSPPSWAMRLAWLCPRGMPDE